eukprot:TRINITY_DN8896_c0_g4_i1.p1 TRINITY_DN8896_c0_g4~~TRINITY_DN8896_c0_g4_i1.p1  ORF type:complete len:596 (-),score=101.99 TRINITY_DN8896_c0_g4_i1:99-1850(-)
MPTPRKPADVQAVFCTGQGCEERGRKAPEYIDIKGSAQSLHSAALVFDVKQSLVEVSTQLQEVLQWQRDLQTRVAQVGADVSLMLSRGHETVNGQIGSWGEKEFAVVSGRPSSQLAEGKLREQLAGSGRRSRVDENAALFTDPDVHVMPNKNNLMELFAVHEAEQYRLDMVKEAGGRGACIEMAIDSLMAFVICVNAVFIGVSMDLAADAPALFFAFDVVFSVIFVTEVAVKVVLKGVCGHFCQENKWSNLFDFMLICIDLFQVALVMFSRSNQNMTNAPSASLFRIIRVVKLSRIIRLLRAAIFADLLVMIRGLIGGLSTLGWSILLFFLVVYVVALLFREFLGRRELENVSEYFENVPRAMLTIFRCSFGDCSSAGGVPIFEHVYSHHGGFMSVLYCLFVFVVSIGIFNVISAMFVESTMKAAVAHSDSQRKQRMADKVLWCTEVTAVIKELVQAATTRTLPDKLSDAAEEINELEIERHELDKLVTTNKEVMRALACLDIAPEENQRLSEVLDPDNGGTISVVDVVDGLGRLRGDPKRSDMVIVEGMVRSLHAKIDALTKFVVEHLDKEVLNKSKCGKIL